MTIPLAHPLRPNRRPLDPLQRRVKHHFSKQNGHFPTKKNWKNGHFPTNGVIADYLFHFCCLSGEYRKSKKRQYVFWVSETTGIRTSAYSFASVCRKTKKETEKGGSRAVVRRHLSLVDGRFLLPPLWRGLLGCSETHKSHLRFFKVINPPSSGAKKRKFSPLA